MGVAPRGVLISRNVLSVEAMLRFPPTNQGKEGKLNQKQHLASTIKRIRWQRTCKMLSWVGAFASQGARLLQLDKSLSTSSYQTAVCSFFSAAI